MEFQETDNEVITNEDYRQAFLKWQMYDNCSTPDDAPSEEEESKNEELRKKAVLRLKRLGLISKNTNFDNNNDSNINNANTNKGDNNNDNPENKNKSNETEKKNMNNKNKKNDWRPKVDFKAVKEEVKNFIESTVVDESNFLPISSIYEYASHESLGIALYLNKFLVDKYVSENKDTNTTCYKYNGVIWEEDKSMSVKCLDTVILEILEKSENLLSEFAKKKDNKLATVLNIKDPSDFHPYEETAEVFIKALKRGIAVINKPANYNTLLERAFAGDVRKDVKCLVFATEQFDRDQYELNTPEGIIDLRTGKIRDSRPDDLRRRCTNASMFTPEELNIDIKESVLYRTITDIFKPIGYPKPFEYDEELTAEQNKTNKETYEKELDLWKSGYYADKSFDFMQLCLGYMMLGENFLHKFFIGIGDTGRNGKGLISRMLEGVFGTKYIATSNSSTFMLGKNERNPGAASPDLMKLKLPRIMLIQENNKNAVINSALVKGVTGSDKVSARPLYKEEEEFKAQAVPFFLTNYTPNFDIYDSALEARCIRIPFLRHFVKKEELKDDSPYLGELIPHLENELLKEKNLILYWIVQGAIKASKLVSLDAPDFFTKYTEKYRAERDYLQIFINNYCFISDSETIRKTDLYKAYQAFASESGIRAWSNQNFYSNLEKKGFEFKKIHGENVVKKITLNDQGLELFGNTGFKSNTGFFTYNSNDKLSRKEPSVDSATDESKLFESVFNMTI